MHQSWENLQNQQPRPQSHEFNQCLWIRRIHNNSQFMSQESRWTHNNITNDLQAWIELKKKVGNV